MRGGEGRKKGEKKRGSAEEIGPAKANEHGVQAKEVSIRTLIGSKAERSQSLATISAPPFDYTPVRIQHVSNSLALCHRCQ